MTYTNDELINKLVDLYENFGDTRFNTIKKCNDMPAACTYKRRFGSIKRAREIANIEIMNDGEGVWKEKLMEVLRDFERGSGPVYYKDVSKNLLNKSGYTITEARNDAGLIFRNPPDKEIDKFDMIKELSKLIKSQNGTVCGDNIDKMCKYSINQYTYAFGNLAHAKSLAGSDNPHSQPSSFWSKTTGEYAFSAAKDIIQGYDDLAEFYIYEIEFDNGNAYYIGQTTDLQRRMSEKECWPSGEPTDISVTSVDTLDKALELENDRYFEIAIEEDTNNVYGGQ